MQSAKYKFWSVRSPSFAFYLKRTCSHQVAVEQTEPVYPEITDVSKEGKLRTERLNFYEHVKQLPTLDQKLHAINENKAWFARIYRVSACPTSYLGTMFHRYITRTHVIDGLPEKVQSINVDIEYESLKPQLLRSILKHQADFWKLPKPERPAECVPDFERGSKLVNELIVHIFSKLGHKNSHLMRAACDPRTMISSYWWHGGFGEEDDQEEKRSLCFQYNECSYYTVRIDQPLPPVVPMDDPLCTTAEVVDYHYHPKVFGIPYDNKHLKCLPGFWPGSPCDFPLLQVLTLDRLERLTNFIDHYSLKPIEDSLLAMASFGWLNGLAMFQGFTPFHPLTYPIVGQTILTNGQEWTFSIYQLNTHTFHNDLDKKDRRNLCWCSPRMRLFDTIHEGELVGLNDDVLKTLIQFIVHPPTEVDQAILKPYLVNEDARTDEEAAEMRVRLRRIWGSRNILNVKNEIPFWQHVYKKHPEAPPSPWVRLE